MKKMLIVKLTVVLFLAISAISNGQTKTGADYFKGKWNTIVKDAPGGPLKMIIGFDKIDKNITGSISDTTGKDMFKVTSVEISDMHATVNFIGSQGEVAMDLDKKDEDHFTGGIMGMFFFEGERIKKDK